MSKTRFLRFSPTLTACRGQTGSSEKTCITALSQGTEAHKTPKKFRPPGVGLPPRNFWNAGTKISVPIFAPTFLENRSSNFRFLNYFGLSTDPSIRVFARNGIVRGVCPPQNSKIGQKRHFFEFSKNRRPEVVIKEGARTAAFDTHPGPLAP